MTPSSTPVVLLVLCAPGLYAFVFRPSADERVDQTSGRGGENKRLQQSESTCTYGYESVEDSTMCLTDSEHYIQGTAGVSPGDIAVILEMHNAYRAAVSPKASLMYKMYWDSELARLAEKWAKQCYFGHEENLGKSRYIPEYDVIPGQNGGFGYDDWNSTVEHWHSESNVFEYGIGYKYRDDEDYRVGHYTQVVHDKSILIGCGYARCSTGYNDFYFCNYLNGQTSYETPYDSTDLEETCVGCQSHCVDNKLCDCGGKYCFNGGALNTDTCTCSCAVPFTGEMCLGDNVLMPVTVAVQPVVPVRAVIPGECRDTEACNPNWPTEYCDRFTNVPLECPKMCNVC